MGVVLIGMLFNLEQTYKMHNNEISQHEFEVGGREGAGYTRCRNITNLLD
jgi:hypothetical protein